MRIRTEVMADDTLLGPEVLTLLSDSDASIECYTKLHDEQAVLSMADRLHMMFAGMRQGGSGAQSWIEPGRSWHS